jgi:hypothetical protein
VECHASLLEEPSALLVMLESKVSASEHQVESVPGHLMTVEMVMLAWGETVKL